MPQELVQEIEMEMLRTSLPSKLFSARTEIGVTVTCITDHTIHVSSSALLTISATAWCPSSIYMYFVG
jgi:hypothetical protein